MYEMIIGGRVAYRTKNQHQMAAWWESNRGLLTPHHIECDGVRLSDRQVQGLVDDMVAARSHNCPAGLLPQKMF